MNKEFLKSLKWIWICVGCLIWFYIIYSIVLHEFYLYKFHNDKQRHGDVCERFRNDCFERVRASLTRGGRFVSTKGYDELPKLRCPDDCLWYTEELNILNDVESIVINMGKGWCLSINVILES